MDKTMEAALAEANATRPRTSHSRGLADAHLAFKVRTVEIRDAYDLAVARAQGNAERARIGAERALALATERARGIAASRRRFWSRFQYAETSNVAQILRHVNLLLSDSAAAYTDSAERPELVCQQRMLATMLRKRGVTL